MNLPGVEARDRRGREQKRKEIGAGCSNLVEGERSAFRRGEDGEQSGAGRVFEHEVGWRHAGGEAGDEAELERRGELEAAKRERGVVIADLDEAQRTSWDWSQRRIGNGLQPPIAVERVPRLQVFTRAANIDVLVVGFAESEGRTIGAGLEEMLAVYEARGRSLVEGAVPAAEARAGRTRDLRIFTSDAVFGMVGRVAAERGMPVPALIEDLLAREVERLDPHGGKFG